MYVRPINGSIGLALLIRILYFISATLLVLCMRGRGRDGTERWEWRGWDEEGRPSLSPQHRVPPPSRALHSLQHIFYLLFQYSVISMKLVSCSDLLALAENLGRDKLLRSSVWSLILSSKHLYYVKLIFVKKIRLKDINFAAMRANQLAVNSIYISWTKQAKQVLFLFTEMY